MHSYLSSSNNTLWLLSTSIGSTNSTRFVYKSIFQGEAPSLGGKDEFGAKPSSSYVKVPLQLHPLKINKMKVAMRCQSHYGKVSEARTNPNLPDDSILSPKNKETFDQFPFPFNAAATFLSTLSNNLINPPLPPSVDPKLVLRGNFAPVDEMLPTECPVIIGSLPSSLQGAYIRNGPNPQNDPVGPHNFLEGDGMLHSIKISGGRATFCSRYVKTYKYIIEKEAGVQLIPNVLSGFYGLLDIFRLVKTLGRVVLGQIHPMKGAGPANATVILFANKLFASSDYDLPYAIKLTKDGDIETIKRYDFDGKLLKSMTPHPKFDPDTGEMFTFRCLLSFPYLTFFCFDSCGVKQTDVPIHSFSRPTFLHDFAITKRYAIFPDIQITIAPLNLIACKGMPMSFDPNKVPRLGFLPRYATNESEMKWFQVPGFAPFHVFNAWDDEDDDNTIIIIALNVINPEHFMYNREKLHCQLEKLRLNMETGMVSSTVLSDKSLELGSINSSYTGKKNRYVYMAVCEDIVPKMSGVVKIDLELEREVGSRIYGHGWYGGEAYFVAADDSKEEDYGYVLSYVHNELSGESQFLVMDAKLPTLDIVAAVKLPGRVPYGFHGLFVSDKDLDQLQ